MLVKFSGLNRKEPYLSLKNGKENFCVLLPYSIKRASEIRKFHVAVMKRRLRYVQKSVMHVQSCYFANTNFILGPIAFLPLSLPSPSPSSLLKLPIVVIQRVLLPW